MAPREPDSPDSQEEAGPPAPEELPPFLVFEASGHAFAVALADVVSILPRGAAPEPGTDVLDLVGLLGRRGGPGPGGCLVVLRSEGGKRPSLAIAVDEARDVRKINPSAILPLPPYVFRRGSPYLGVVPARDGGAAVFVIAGAARLAAEAERA